MSNTQYGRPYTDVMVDLETLGTLPGSAILSIGACKFDPVSGEVDVNNTFYSVISTQDCYRNGLFAAESTVAWWNDQSREARQVLIDASLPDAPMLAEALDGFTQWFTAGGMESPCVWSNGANFDQPLLDVAYSATKRQVPWKYYNSRCYRTVKALHPNPKAVEPPTVLAHHALEDALWQARHLVAMLKDIKGGR